MLFVDYMTLGSMELFNRPYIHGLVPFFVENVGISIAGFEYMISILSQIGILRKKWESLREQVKLD